uniref:Integrase n=1 Tax=Panagrellus redivivus TaxID=6233 RepID=A0A7E4ZRZ6_PANRE
MSRLGFRDLDAALERRPNPLDRDGIGIRHKTVPWKVWPSRMARHFLDLKRVNRSWSVPNASAYKQTENRV